jgi:hypothetical protein
MAALALGALVGAAPGAEGEDPAAALAASKERWVKAREQCQGSYTYWVRTASWVGARTETTIVVERNKVIERRYKATSGRAPAPAPGPAPRAEGDVEWVETGDEVGKHKEGAPPRTLDQLYDEARQVVERPRGKHERLVQRFDRAGLLLACFTVDTRIMDDAPIKGVNIAEIKLAERKAE